jgi:uncharacterized protein (DUF433 family)
MQIEDYFDFLGADDIRIKGTRIGIESILYDFIHRSHSPETIADSYPSLDREQVYATITYYLHNEEKISAYLARWIEHGQKMRAQQNRNPTPMMLRLRKIRGEREAQATHP